MTNKPDKHNKHEGNRNENNICISLENILLENLFNS